MATKDSKGTTLAVGDTVTVSFRIIDIASDSGSMVLEMLERPNPRGPAPQLVIHPKAVVK